MLCTLHYGLPSENHSAEIAEIAEDAPAEAPTAEAPVPAPAATLEIVHERPHSKNKEKST